MQTRKLYYEDCRTKEFSARVLSCRETKKGYEIILDATAFYPEGGGQPCDLGMLECVHVLDVQEQGEEILHLCDGPLKPDTIVEGRIDYTRRFALMQQHAGEHIVSGIIHKLYGHDNVGFHMGKEAMEIDFSGPVPQEDVEKIETMANEIVWRDVPIKCWYPEKAELKKIPYRSKKALEWPVRIVEIPGADSCACCGVHVATTGQIGLIKILSCVKFKQGVRMELACGQQALRHIQTVYQQNREVSQVLSAKMHETGEAARKIREALDAEKFRSTGLQRQVFSAIAREYRGKEHIVRFEKDLSSSQLRELADTCCREGAKTAAILSGTDESGYQICIVSACEDLRITGKAFKEAFPCRGGGKQDSFQGSVTAKQEDLTAFFSRLWENGD